MAVYRYQGVCVGRWRGKIKRWNTTFHMTSSGNIDSLRAKLNATGWKVAGDIVGACSGGVSSITVYNATGGAPIAQRVYFDWETPTTWIPYDGTGWVDIDPATTLDASGESALVVEGNMAALSTTGKPVKTRKFFHAIPSRTAAGFTDPDVSAAVVSQMKQLWTPDYLLNPGGVQPVSATPLPFYGNHQRVRGRRRTVRQAAAGSFSAGVIAGSGVTPKGAASPQ